NGDRHQFGTLIGISRNPQYVEPLTGQTINETTGYTMPTPTNVYSYPVVTSLINASQITFPDGSYQLLYTTSLCPSDVKSRDLCVAVPYKLFQRDGTWREFKWVSNTAAPGVPSGAPFNPYVQYTVERPLNATVSRVAFTARDFNGNITSTKEYNWVSDSAIVRDPNTGVIMSVCEGGGDACTPVSTRTTTYYAATSYWERTAPITLRAPRSVTHGNAVTAFFYDNELTTANATRVERAGAAGASTINTYATYLGNGNLVSFTDANGNRTLICYDANNLYPTTRVAGATSSASCPNPAARPEGRRTTYVFDFASGVQSSETDADNSVTTAMTYDNLGRATGIEQTAPGLKRVTVTDYDDATRMITTTRDDTATQKLITKEYFDPLGRLSRFEDPTGKKIDKAYRFDANGVSYEVISNPYASTSDATMGWTLTTRQVPTPGSLPLKVEATTYSGSALPAPWGSNASKTGTTSVASKIAPDCAGAGTATTDGAGNTTTHCTDGLGRLSSVKEPDGTTTQYSYDERGNLVGVDVAGQYRAFEYDSLDRLQKACNPETGTVNCTTSPLPSSGLERYTYDANGNPLTRTDARGIITTLAGYDALNRLQTKTYSRSDGSPEGTPGVTYVYDEGRKGVLSSVSTSTAAGVFSTAYTYDGLGRVQTSTQVTGGQNPYVFGYQYSLTDRLSQIEYPSGRKVNYVPDGVGRVLAVQEEASGLNYASLDYTGQNGIPKMTLGNGIIEQTGWNDRMQMTGLTVGKQGEASALTLGYYPCPGLAVSCASGNNGNIRGQTISLPGLSVTQSYGYDSAGRLTGVSEAGAGAWNETYRYSDAQGTARGNRWVELSERSGLPEVTLETPVGATWYLPSNRINTWGTDAAGNVETVGAMERSFGYDAENRQVSATINGEVTTYVYDGEGRRVQKIAGPEVTTYVYDAGGNLAAEYVEGQAGASGCGTATCYVTVDELGSTRLVTDGAGNVARRYDYMPFGGEIVAGTNGRTTGMGYPTGPDGFNPKYTGQMRDVETGLDYFHARYYSAAQGRFTSPDPGNAGAVLGEPQTWNGYAYVSNNPVNLTDPSGLGIFGTIFGVVAGLLTANPWVGLAASAAGNGLDAAIWGPQAAGIPGTPFNLGSLTSCGGPLGNCGSLGAGPWSEISGIGGNVQDPGRFIFSLEKASQSASALDEVGYFLAGLSDSLSFGWTGRTRESRGLELPPCGGAYAAGEWAPAAIGGLRLAYAASAKAIPFVVRAGASQTSRALTVSAVRNQLKVLYRFGLGGGYRLYSDEQILAKYGNDASRVIGAATRTNSTLNTVGGLGVVGTAANTRGCRP
ncbi:MAG: hypothetical protein LC130_03905, partial [Bryobacterales bacterium]|nr:hypothetical protein [Bryobacterales bacterium]